MHSQQQYRKTEYDPFVYGLSHGPRKCVMFHYPKNMSQLARKSSANV